MQPETEAPGERKEMQKERFEDNKASACEGRDDKYRGCAPSSRRYMLVDFSNHKKRVMCDRIVC